MKLGMLTACLPGWNLEQLATFAAEVGYETLEVAAWPGTGGRDFEAAHLPVAQFSQAAADDVNEMLQRHNLSISALAYYENNLIGDLDRREEIRTHLKHCIDAAQLLGVDYVGTFLGRDNTKSVTENMREAERVFPELVDYAGERGVGIIIENCVMEGWHPDGYPGNIAYSPELWEWMCPTLGLYLNWDPSHLTWLGIDPVSTIEEFAPYIVHAQAKDLEIFPEKRNRYGHYGLIEKRGNPWAMGWWRYRVPGRGMVDWSKVVDKLYEVGFDGVLSVEHEDPVWGGTEPRVVEGLRIAQSHLRPLIISESNGA